MRFREFPMLSADEDDLRVALGTGLGTEAATVLTYLVGRRESPDVSPTPATRPVIQIGTGLGRDATIEATKELEAANLVDTTSARTFGTETERKAWVSAQDRASIVGTVRHVHANGLLDKSRNIFGSIDQRARRRENVAGEEGRQSLTLALNWESNVVHVPILVATENGWYGDRDIDLILQEQHGSGEAINSLLDGDCDLCIAGPATIMRALHEGKEIFPIALLYQRSTAVLYTMRDHFGDSFESIEQLRGRTVAMIPDSETGTIGRLFLSQADVLADVEVIETADEERNHLLIGDADVATGIISDPIRMEESGYQVDSILIGRHFPIPGLAIVTRPGTLDNRYDALVDFLAGTMQGWHAAQVSPARVAANLDDVLEEPKEILIDHLIEEFGISDSVREHGWGWQTEKQWTRLHSAMEQTGLLSGPL